MNYIEIYFIGSVLVALALYGVRSRAANFGLMAVFAGLQVGLVVHEYQFLNVLEDRFFRADELSLIFLATLTLVGAATILHYFIFSVSRRETPHVFALHNTALVVFIMAMSGALLATHLGVLWAFLEATTLAASLLIYHNRTQLTLEAAWKYIFVCSIGIALAFGGILILSAALHETPNFDLSLDYLRQHAHEMNPTWLKISFLLAFTGFSVKMGVVPLFNVDIDAKDVAPSPIGALLSGGLMNVGFMAIFRFYQTFSGTEIYGWMNNVLMLSGALSLVLAAVFLLKTGNYKRFLAYSSLEHGGLVLLALSMGRAGFYAAILHLVFHSLVKASLFFQIGQVYRVYGGKMFDQVGHYFKLNPWGGLVLMFGFASIAALPPSGMFLSEWLAFSAMWKRGEYLILILSLALLTVALYAMAKKFFHLLFSGVTLQTPNAYATIHPMETFTQFVFLLGVVYLGVAPPQQLLQLIETAAKTLPL